MDEYLEPASYQSYYYANNQILAQLQRDTVNSDWYYYLCDRLGSVRTLIDCNSDTVNSYTYDPFGNQLESETHETVDNPYQFAGYRWDEDAEMFYCNARWYNPEIYRFTGRDPVRGKFNRPMSLHAYLYCANDPFNRIDPDGEMAIVAAKIFIGAVAGAVSSYRSSDGDAWATAVGAAAGMISGFLPPGTLGVVVGSIMGGGVNAYAEYRQHGDARASALGFTTGAISGGLGGLVGGFAAGGLGFGSSTGLAAFVSSQIVGSAAGEYYGMCTDPTMEVLEAYENRPTNEYYKALDKELERQYKTHNSEGYRER